MRYVCINYVAVLVSPEEDDESVGWHSDQLQRMFASIVSQLVTVASDFITTSNNIDYRFLFIYKQFPQFVAFSL